MLGTGDRIGDWIVEGHVGSGGMGSVFRCRNVLAERIRAAVKVVHPDPSEDFRERFVREVEALESLEHPAIVRVKGWGEDTERGLLWLAMDLVQGRDLSEVLEGGPIVEERARRIFAPLARGLHHAHSQGVFHRDIKPANVLLGDDDVARMVDFGIAMHDGRTRMSAAGVVPGTPAYLAPEVFGGHPIPRGLDVYAFGQMLHEALTGAPAFPQPDGLTSTARIAHVAGLKLRGEALDPGPAFSSSMRELVRRTTQPDPYRRLVDLEAAAVVLEGAELSADLASGTLFLDDIPSLPDLTQEPPLLATRGVPSLPPVDRELPDQPPPSPPDRPRPVSVRPSRAPWVMVAVLLGILSGVGIWSWLGPAADAPIRIAVDARSRAALWVDGVRHEATARGVEVVADGPVVVRTAAGPHCPLDEAADTCPACCACTTEMVANSGVVFASGPTAPTRLLVEVDEPAGVTLLLDDEPLASGVPAVVVPGAHQVVAERGVCALADRGCGETCPPGCRSVRAEVVAVCHETVQRRLVVPAPDEVPVAKPLAGKYVKVFYMRDEFAAAERAAKRWRRMGARVEVEARLHAPTSYFNKVIPTPDRAAAATILATLPESTLQESASATTVEWDVTVWFKERR